MSRFDIALNKKHLVKKTISKVKKTLTSDSILNKTFSQISNSFMGRNAGDPRLQAGLQAGLQGYTGSQGSTAIGWQGSTGLQGATQGPTSRHVLIGGPDGHRALIPLRSLAYSISSNGNGSSTIHITIPTNEANSLETDIQRGLRREEEVQRNRYG